MHARTREKRSRNATVGHTAREVHTHARERDPALEIRK